jgi:hypothetical protein
MTKLDSLISGQKALKERVSKIEKLLQDNDSKDNQVEKTKEFIEVFTCELISKTNIYILQFYANYYNY